MSAMIDSGSFVSVKGFAAQFREISQRVLDGKTSNRKINVHIREPDMPRSFSGTKAKKPRSANNERPLDPLVFKSLAAATTTRNGVIMMLSRSDVGSINRARDENGYPIACLAVSLSYGDLLRWMGSYGCNLSEVCSPTGLSALMMAAKLGDVEILKLLVFLNADPSVRDADGRTALHWAAMSGSVNALAVLVPSFASSIDVLDNSGSSPLHSASMCGHVDVVKFLIRSGACVSLRNKSGSTPVDVAHAQSDVTHWLKGADSLLRYLSSDKFRLGRSSSKTNGVLDFLPPATADTRKGDTMFGGTLTSCCSSQRESEIFTYLVSEGITFRSNEEGMNAVEEILNEADLTRENLLHACKFADEVHACAAVEASLAVISPNTVDTECVSRLSVLQWAVLRNMPKLVAALLSAKADVNFTDPATSKLTPLHLAVLSNSVACVDLLLKAHADIRTETVVGDTVLGLAMAQDAAELVGKILDSDPTVKDEPIFDQLGGGDSVSPVLVASRRGLTEVVRMLIERGVDLDVKDLDGKDAFLAACTGGFVETAMTLLDHRPLFVRSTSSTGEDGLSLISKAPYMSSNNGGEADTELEWRKFVEAFVRGGTEFGIRGSDLLIAAAVRCNSPLVEALVVFGASGVEEAIRAAETAGLSHAAARIYHHMHSSFSRNEPVVVVDPSLCGYGLSRVQNVSALVQSPGTPLALRVENIVPIATAVALADWFTSHGAKPAHVRVMAEAITGRPLEYAYVAFWNRHTLIKAVGSNGQSFMHRRVKMFLDEYLLHATGAESDGALEWIDPSGGHDVLDAEQQRKNQKRTDQRRKALKFAPSGI